MGLFGLMIPEEYGGLGESLLTYALVVEEIARGWMSVSGIVNTHFIVAYMLMQHGTEEQKQHYLPRMATGEVRGAFSMSEPGCGSDVAAITHQGRARRRRLTCSTARRCGSPTAATSNLLAVLVKTDEGPDTRSAAPQHDDVPHREGTRSRRGRPPALTIPGKIEKMGYKGVDTTELRSSTGTGSAATASSAARRARVSTR